jgi:hypothetical protein
MCGVQYKQYFYFLTTNRETELLYCMFKLNQNPSSDKDNKERSDDI